MNTTTEVKHISRRTWKNCPRNLKAHDNGKKLMVWKDESGKCQVVQVVIIK